MFKQEVTWAEVDGLASLISRQIVESDRNYSGLLGISGGGLILAVLLSKKLDIPLLNTPQNRCIIVDEVADTGKRLKKLYDNHVSTIHGGTIYTATFFERQKSTFSPDFVGRTARYEDWIIFPWDYTTHAVENSQTII
jgi:hypoxanthine phosphoribosyltransferase